MQNFSSIVKAKPPGGRAMNNACSKTSNPCSLIHRLLTWHCSSSISKRCRQNAINGDLCRTKHISSDFNTKRYRIVNNLKTQVNLHLSLIVSSEIVGVNEIKEKTKKIRTLSQFISLKLQENRHWKSFHIFHRMSS